MADEAHILKYYYDEGDESIWYCTHPDCKTIRIINYHTAEHRDIKDPRYAHLAHNGSVGGVEVILEKW